MAGACHGRLVPPGNKGREAARPVCYDGESGDFIPLKSFQSPKGLVPGVMVPNRDIYQQVEIVHRRDVAPDLWTIRVRPTEPLRFTPGQYATLGMLEGVQLIERPYSIVSSPLEDEVEFFFELVPGSGLTPLLHRMKVGETFWMDREARGRFAFDNESGHKSHFFAATVTGIAPFISMVRTLALQSRTGSQPNHQVCVLHGASRSWEHAYRAELELISRDANWFRYVATVSRPKEDPTWVGEVGRVEEVLRKHFDASGFDPAATTAYLCGHPDMISSSRRILERRGVLMDSIRQEVYWVPDEISE